MWLVFTKKISHFLVLPLLILMLILTIYCVYYNKIGDALTAISILFVIVSWIENRKNEIASIQRNKQLEFLEDSYKKIAMGVDRSPDSPDNKKFQEGLEEAIATIQLYGEPKLLATLKEVLIVKEKALGKVSPGLSSVLNELRNSLREEFKLEKVEDEVISFRTVEEQKKIEEYNNKQKLQLI